MKISPIPMAVLLTFLLAAGNTFAQTAPSSKIETDVVYGHKDGLALTMDIYRPESKSNGAAIAFIVSGGWYSRWSPPEGLKPAFQPFLDKGYTMIAIRHGSSPRFSIPEAVADVQQAIRFIHQSADRLAIDPHRIGVMGNSAGGHLSLMLGTAGDDGQPDADDELGKISSRVAAVVARVPPTDLRVAVWESPESLPAYRNFPALDLPLDAAEKVSPLAQVTSDDAPSLVIMGGADKLVPPKHGRWIDKAFLENDVAHKLIIVPDAGHGLQGTKTRTLVGKETMAWFDNYLTPPPQSPENKASSPQPKKPKMDPIDVQGFQDAAFENNVEKVRQAMIQGININALDANQRTALMLAAFQGHTKVVQLLTKNKATLELRDSAGRTALLFAASGPNVETVKVLLDAGAAIDTVDSAEHFSALMFAAAEGQAEVVQILLDHHADKSLKDIDGDTARDFAAKNGHLAVVQLLEK